jgi:GxxExxY protein
VALIHEELTGRIIGAAMEVHRTLGCGFLEAVYQEALELELELREIAFQKQPELVVTYKGRTLRQRYKPDLIVDGKVIVEIKAIVRLTAVEEAQAINYLKGTGCMVALLINFGSKSLEWKRLVLEAKRSQSA